MCAIVLLFESGFVHDSTRGLAIETHQYLASVIGMSASVQPTELNQLTAELTKMEHDLQAREAAIREREIQVGITTGGAINNDATTYVLAGVLFILLVLIILNYTLDYLRLRELQRSRPV